MRALDFKLYIVRFRRSN